MTLLPAVRPGRSRTSVGARVVEGRPPTSRRTVLLAAAACVLVRLAFAARPVGRDEAGFLLVGSQWGTGTGSLYGSYWVDRPPLLITFYWLGDLLGGLVALRVLGALAAGTTVLVLAAAARRTWGARAGAAAAVLSAALLSSHLLATLEVNGELLAAPFLAIGTAAALASARDAELGADGPGRSGTWAALAGACAVAAVMVKQNMADVAVFGLALAAAYLWAGRVRPADLLRPLAGALVGTGVALLAVVVWTTSRDTSPVAVFDALYPFRLEAAAVIAGDEGAGESLLRLGRVVGAFAASGLGLLVVLAVVLAWTRRRTEPVLVAAAATLAYDLFSVLGGGVYWLHYLVELVPAASLVVAYAVASAPRGSGLRAAALLALGLAVVSSGVSLVRAAVVEPRTTQREVGSALVEAASPGDTLVTLYGDSDLNYLAGLASPYEHLWNLPIKVRDPGLDGLDAVLAGGSAPTWVVGGRSLETWGLDTRRTRHLLAERYVLVESCTRYDVYLRAGLDRPAPDCAATRP